MPTQVAAQETCNPSGRIALFWAIGFKQKTQISLHTFFLTYDFCSSLEGQMGNKDKKHGTNIRIRFLRVSDRLPRAQVSHAAKMGPAPLYSLKSWWL